jgi:hypothetical protein
VVNGVTMPARTLETDYLVIGAGAAGMAFVDALVADSTADVVMLDHRHAPGGHWHDAYPFVRLHQPSAYYGVNSLPLGGDTIDRHGPNEGFYERASAPEICAYYDRVMREKLLASGRVRYLPMTEYLGDRRFVSRLTGTEGDVRVRRSVVDARYLEPSVPATTRPPFAVEAGARVVPLHELAAQREPADAYTIVGAGKTAVDACLWLLELGVSPEAIRWIRPRDAWFVNRRFAQGGELVGMLLEGIARQVEALAAAESREDLFARLCATDQLLRVDGDVSPSMYKAATMSVTEVDALRRIRNVVRLGRVREVGRDRITLEGGSVQTTSGTVHVHCAAAGLNPAPAVPIFQEERIVLQPIRSGLIPFNAAIVGYLEATRGDLAEKNRLCPPNRLPDVPLDWIRGTLISMTADHGWARDAAIAAWLEGARLNPSRGLRHRGTELDVADASKRFAENVRPALEKARKLLAEAPE